MKDVVDEVIYIDEKSYQQFKKKMGKSDDYFNLEEVKSCQTSCQIKFKNK